MELFRHTGMVGPGDSKLTNVQNLEEGMKKFTGDIQAPAIHGDEAGGNSLPIQSIQFSPYCDKITWPRIMLQIIHVFLSLSCPGMHGYGKVSKINVLFAMLYKIEDA